LTIRNCRINYHVAILRSEVAALINEEVRPGRYSINFNAVGLASGVYLYRIQAGKYISVKKNDFNEVEKFRKL
jgi:hypothetical protein